MLAGIYPSVLGGRPERRLRNFPVHHAPTVWTLSRAVGLEHHAGEKNLHGFRSRLAVRAAMNLLLCFPAAAK
jgi:hypothetical protein